MWQLILPVCTPRGRFCAGWVAVEALLWLALQSRKPVKSERKRRFEGCADDNDFKATRLGWRALRATRQLEPLGDELG